MKNTIQPKDFATLEQLLVNVVPEYMNPLPSSRTLLRWLRRRRIPRYKCAAMKATRGRQPILYSTKVVRTELANQFVEVR